MTKYYDQIYAGMLSSRSYSQLRYDQEGVYARSMKTKKRENMCPPHEKNSGISDLCFSFFHVYLILSISTQNKTSVVISQLGYLH